jgi:hypothetical protein
VPGSCRWRVLEKSSCKPPFSVFRPLMGDWQHYALDLARTLELGSSPKVASVPRATRRRYPCCAPPCERAQVHNPPRCSPALRPLPAAPAPKPFAKMFWRTGTSFSPRRFWQRRNRQGEFPRDGRRAQKSQWPRCQGCGLAGRFSHHSGLPSRARGILALFIGNSQYRSCFLNRQIRRNEIAGRTDE